MITFLLKILIREIWLFWQNSPSDVINKEIIVNKIEKLALENFVVCFIELLTANICQF